MSKKHKADQRGYVYSTDPDFRMDADDMEQQTLEPGKQQLRLRFETKHRGGKAVTIIDGFVGTAGDLEDLGRRLKTHCGTGGSAKDGEILVQGDQREKVKQWLLKQGFKVK